MPLTAGSQLGPYDPLPPRRRNALGTGEFVPARDGQRFLAANATSAPQGHGCLTVVVNRAAEVDKR